MTEIQLLHPLWAARGNTVDDIAIGTLATIYCDEHMAWCKQCTKRITSFNLAHHAPNGFLHAESTIMPRRMVVMGPATVTRVDRNKSGGVHRLRVAREFDRFHRQVTFAVANGAYAPLHWWSGADLVGAWKIRVGIGEAPDEILEEERSAAERRAREVIDEANAIRSGSAIR